MMYSCGERRMIWSLRLIFSVSYSILVFASPFRPLCRPDQKDALQEFKNEFNVPKNVLSKIQSWGNNTDCCSWDGVTCDPKTGNVIELNLTAGTLNNPLGSNSSLFRLQHLQSLYLSHNNFSGVLPDSISNLKYLRVLRLHNCSFFGKIPSSFGNFSYLTDLSLSCNDFTGELPDSISNLKRLSKLQLALNKLSGNFPHVLLNLSELTRINLAFNRFEGMLPSNMSSLSRLEHFYIIGNSFSGSIPSSLFMIPSLMELYLGSNGFSGSLAIGIISSPSKLEILDLGDNNFNGPIPEFISKLVSLWYLNLSYWNTGRAMVDFSIFSHLKSLNTLYLSHLNTRSKVDLSVFSHLMSLTELDLSGINLKNNSTLHLLLPMDFLALSSCNITELPKFLQAQTNLSYLDISDNQIEGQVPEWLWRLPMLETANISHNSFSGFEGSADALQNSVLVLLDISSNKFQGPLPLLPNSMQFLLSSENWFSGEIPREICKLVELETLVLSNNNFSGSIPPCISDSISVLHLQNNSLSNIFPEDSIGDRLISLDVGHNQLSGKLPNSLINCTRLQFLNVEDNKLSDKFPFWLRLLPNLQILVLRSNEFHGPISSLGDSLSFRKLRIFDISENRFTGVLPPDYFAGWTALSSVVDFEDNAQIRFLDRGPEVHDNSVDLATKGLKMKLIGSVFTMYKTIDVSGNRLEGLLPESIGFLKEMIVLNMSNNAFTGCIPPSLSNLTKLESLDLSRNGLSGEIPPELGKLTFLAMMNFSYNRLEGLIPKGTQIQSQNSSSFAENPGLCGVPLQRNCSGGEEEEQQDEEKIEKEQVLSWVAAAIAYVPGVFCGFVISHILTSYRHDWFVRIFHYFT